MAATSQITVTAATPLAITPVSACKSVRVMENRGVAGWPTSDFLIYKPTNLVTPVRVPAGSSYTFSTNQIGIPTSPIGYIKMVSGTTTFDQDEDSFY
jgi:hypothetical protein